MKSALTIMVAGTLVTTGTVCGQSLYAAPPVVAPASGQAVDGTQAVASGQGVPLNRVGLYFITPPEPRLFMENDQITIIISERNKMERTQTLETEKSYEIDAAVTDFVDLMQLFELRLDEQEGAGDLPSLGLGMETETENEGTYEREDKLTARVTARVVEVKPNGVLLIEARTTTVTDEEVQTITLSGFCRQEDVTVANTVQSNQLYDMTLNMQHAGEVRKAAKKGFVPSFLDALFGF